MASSRSMNGKEGNRKEEGVRIMGIDAPCSVPAVSRGLWEDESPDSETLRTKLLHIIGPHFGLNDLSYRSTVNIIQRGDYNTMHQRNFINYRTLQ